MNIDEVMLSLPPFSRFYWCGAGEDPPPYNMGCGCIGCADLAVKANGFTKADWQEWVDRNEPPEYEVARQLDLTRSFDDILTDAMRITQGKANPNRMKEAILKCQAEKTMNTIHDPIERETDPNELGTMPKSEGVLYLGGYDHRGPCSTCGEIMIAVPKVLPDGKKYGGYYECPNGHRIHYAFRSF